MSFHAYKPPECCGKPTVRIDSERERIPSGHRVYVTWRCPTCRRMQTESRVELIDDAALDADDLGDG